MIKSRSQCCQDLVVQAIFKNPSSYLDVGCGDPIECSNTFVLDNLGWQGICIDREPHDYSGRKCKFINEDALTALKNLKGLQVDYLSLDIDDATNEALGIILKSNIKFKFATVEHDLYRLGENYQSQQRKMLQEYGYNMIFGNLFPSWSVSTIYEDWWTHPDFFSGTLGCNIDGDSALKLIRETQSLQPTAFCYN